MGELEFEFERGKYINIGHFEFCDQCQSFQNVADGEIQTLNELQIGWLCGECK